MADNSYYPQTQGDSSKAEAEKHVTTISSAIATEDRIGPYYPGNAKSVFVVADQTCQIQCRGAGSPGIADDVFRNAQVQYADIQNPNATKAGVITSTAMPHEFYVYNTSNSSAAACTIYINY